jgi:hypothetical protein
MQNAEEFVHEESLVPLALIAIETGESVDMVAFRLGGAVELDDIGMQAVRADVARQFFAERAEQKVRAEEEFERLQEAASRDAPAVGVGVPALDDASPFESLLAGDRSYVSPAQEFGTRPRPTFLVDEIEQGQRQQAQARAEAEAKKAKR